MAKLTIVIALLLISQIVMANHRLQKLEDTLEKRIQDIRIHPQLTKELNGIMLRYRKANEGRLEMERRGSHKKGETHYMSDLLSILIDLYQIDDRVLQEKPLY